MDHLPLVRNTIRFMLGNLFDFDPLKDRVEFENLNEADKYVTLKLNNLIKDSINHYDHFEFDTVYREITNFVTKELSAFYLDFTKDVLYIEKYDNPDRRSIQTVLYDITTALLKLLTPFIPHTTYEAYKHLPLQEEAHMYLENMPKYKELGNEDLLSKYEKFMAIRDNVLKALEVARNEKVIGKSFGAKLTLYPKGEVKELLNSMNANLGQMFIVSQFEIKDGKGIYEFNNLTIDVEKAEGTTCDRCWQIVAHTHDGLCRRCEEIIK